MNVNEIEITETRFGKWTGYGGDGRMTADEVDGQNLSDEGTGWRACVANYHGKNYGWGPLADNEAEAIEAAKAEWLEILTAEFKD